ncbi:MAG: 50S ribosomal protein L3 [Candidatus Colwellbacteria bacterium]|nr:50S ribosomal protein L3 [Candidatus Colwellbacteria bacterium]
MEYVKGIKVKMGQVFREEDVVPVTFIKLQEGGVEFAVGDKVQVSGVSKGKGFQGVVKRHGFSGAAMMTHGTKHTNRAPGSIGATGPQRVFPGTRMGGRMGGDNINAKKLKVVAYEKEENLLLVKGAVPGVKGGKLKIYNLSVK